MNKNKNILVKTQVRNLWKSHTRMYGFNRKTVKNTFNSLLI